MKMRQAAQWIGNFHAKSEAQFTSAKIPNIITYNTEYYEGWIARARENCSYLHVGYPWFLPLCERAGELLSHLLTCPLVIIHGEYYPKNILTNENGIVPIDWESTALAAGEIDLAMLTEGWLEEDLGDFMAVYQAARWPEGLAENFKQRLAAAQLYIHFRWLGDHPWSQEEPPLRFDLMYRLARQLHLI
jgi:thiamine kinase-like enzyme